MQRGKIEYKSKKVAECDPMERARPCFFTCLWHSTKEGLEVFLISIFKNLSLLLYHYPSSVCPVSGHR